MAEASYDLPVQLAAAALRAGVDGKWKTAEAILVRLGTECGSDGLGDALVAWCDAVLEHGNDGMPEFGRIKVAHFNADSGALNVREEITPERAWTARLLAARGAGDLDAFREALQEINALADDRARGRYVAELVTSAALTIRTLPRGYNRLGKGEADA
jgi:hypothetical protein